MQNLFPAESLPILQYVDTDSLLIGTDSQTIRPVDFMKTLSIYDITTLLNHIHPLIIFPACMEMCKKGATEKIGKKGATEKI